MSVGDEAEAGRSMESGLANGHGARPLWRVPRIQAVTLAETQQMDGEGSDFGVFSDS